MAEIPAPISHTIGAIYEGYERTREEGERTYLGMSTFGTDCDRALWYGFRKAHEPEQLDGRKLRLFATGHREEDRMVADLERAGITVEATNPENGKQWGVSALGGHFRGHLDGIVSGLPEAPKTEHVLETKTHNDKSFKALLKSGVAASKPGHFAQMTLYMHFTSLTRALYLAHNKNDDTLHTERVEYDPVAALQLVARAERIISADRAPAKLHEDPEAKAAFACGWCAAKAICHENKFARSHCRTCIHSTPVIDDSDDATWHCARWDKILPVEEQLVGCPAHRFIPDLVPGEQLDVIGDDVVVYRLADGSEWHDGEGRAA